MEASEPGDLLHLTAASKDVFHRLYPGAWYRFTIDDARVVSCQRVQERH
ncbi:MAG TPA: hypothetical protein VH817_01415 [Thermoleophilaceae bacterium]